MTHSRNRSDLIFKCIVEQYVETTVPVGSRVVSKIYDGNLSPATIRNVMVDLEEDGLIQQPYTSAGRIPTERGYRYYVDRLMGQCEVSDEVEAPNWQDWVEGVSDIEEAAERISRVLADRTGNAGLTLLRNVHRVSKLNQKRSETETHTGRVSDRLYWEGSSNIFEQPEFQQVDRISSFLKAFEFHDSLVDFLTRSMRENQTHIHIGSEVDCDGLHDIAVVIKEYKLDGETIGCLAVMGPTRMKYSQTVRVVDEMARAMTDILNYF